MTLQEHIDEVMDYLDFNKIHRAMVALDWHWVRSKGIYEIPDIATMRQDVRDKINYAWEHASIEHSRHYYISSGGFEVEVDLNEDCVSVKFVVDKWDSYSDFMDADDENE